MHIFYKLRNNGLIKLSGDFRRSVGVKLLLVIDFIKSFNSHLIPFESLK